MNISVLVRLIPTTRTAGRLAGQAEIVETGQTVVFAGPAEVLAFLDQAAAGMFDPSVAATFPTQTSGDRSPSGDNPGIGVVSAG